MSPTFKAKKLISTEYRHRVTLECVVRRKSGETVARRFRIHDREMAKSPVYVVESSNRRFKSSFSEFKKLDRALSAWKGSVKGAMNGAPNGIYRLYFNDELVAELDGKTAAHEEKIEFYEKAVRLVRTAPTSQKTRKTEDAEGL
ncbi:MAG: hypothetical protein KatS3mg104_2977 [Phycisphaerae bacterium]|nr:MAG: hypothetical protein KatS3mg104_2977 [Phycisphaerae bacterium]